METCFENDKSTRTVWRALKAFLLSPFHTTLWVGINRCIHCLPKKRLPGCNQVILQHDVDFHSTFVVCGLGEVVAANASTCLSLKRKDGSGLAADRGSFQAVGLSYFSAYSDLNL